MQFIKKITGEQKLFFGTFNEVYEIVGYTEEDVRNKLLVFYDQNIYGRGIGCIVDTNYDIELTLNHTATKNDIEIFYKFIYRCCNEFEINSFIQEGKQYNLDHIENLKEDYYYAKPLIYQISGSDKYAAKYVLTENVPTIFPYQQSLQFGMDQNLEDKIEKWEVAFVQENNGDFEVVEEILFDELEDAINVENFPKFDSENIIITCNNKMILKTKKFNIEKAEKQLKNWLELYDDYKSAAIKIEYTNSFKDTNDVKCYVFKYKKKLI